MELYIILIILFILFIILGLLIDKKKKYNIENFDISNNNDIESGASTYYNRELPDEKIYNDNQEDKKDDNKQTCNDTYNYYNKDIDYYFITLNGKRKKINEQEICKKCDITMNDNIDKYVLKSSIPPCPDMSNYVTKNMIGCNINMKDYIHKSEIKPCPNIDMSEYIKKTEIKPCPICQECQKYVECPKCPPLPNIDDRGTKIYNYKITEHPDIKDYIPITKFKELAHKCKNKIDEYKKRNENIDEDIRRNERKFKEEQDKWNNERKFKEEQDKWNNEKKNNNLSINNGRKNNSKLLLDVPGSYTGDSLYAVY